MNNAPLRISRLPLPPTDEQTARAIDAANAEDAREGAGAVLWGCACVLGAAGLIVGVLLAMVFRH